MKRIWRQAMLHTGIVALLLTGTVGLRAETFESSPIGWASMNGGTTGGEGGAVVTVSTRAELLSYVQKSGKYVIQIAGIINLNKYEQISIGSDKTLIGITCDAGIRYGGLLIKDAKNVIIRNLKIWDSYDGDWSGKTHDTDGIAIFNSHHVWIDHCDLSAHADGQLDVTGASDYVTISWCKFSNHNKNILIGAGDAYYADRGKLRVTLHHNYFDGASGRGLFQRNPSVRFGDVHLFNNYYDGVGVDRTGGTGWGYSIMSRIEADVLVENNYFKNTTDPHEPRADGTNPDLEAIGNIYDGCRGAKSQTGQSFDPPYVYALEPAANVPAVVGAGSGVCKMTVVTPTPTPTMTPTVKPTATPTMTPTATPTEIPVVIEPGLTPTPPSAAVPEPGTFMLLGLGVFGLLWSGIWRIKKK